MKNFFKQITRNPYADWVVIMTLGAIGVLLVVIWSFVTYQKVAQAEDVTLTATTTRAVSVDVNKLNSIVDTLKKKSEIYNAPKLPVIDVRDPSL